MAQDFIFDSDYTGPRFTYGLRFRPLSMVTVPKGWIIKSDRIHAGFAHGTVDYPAPLTEAQIAAFELTQVVR